MTDTKDLSLLAINDRQVEFTQPQMDALTRSLKVRYATEADLRMFFHQCRRTGLDPFLRQIYLIARQEWNADTKQKEWRQTVQTGIEGFRVVAQRAARQEGVTLEHLPVRYWDDQGNEFDAWWKDEPPAMIRYTVKMGGVPYSWDGRFSEYVPMKDEYYKEDVEDADGKVIHKKGDKTGNRVPQGLWATRPIAMLEKCCEAGALRRARAQDLGGIYIEEEMQRYDNGRVVDVEPDDVHDDVSTGEDWFAQLAEATSGVQINDIWTRCKAAGERTPEFDKAARERATQIKEAQGDADAPDAAENDAETPASEAAEAPESVGSESNTPTDPAAEASQKSRETPVVGPAWVDPATGDPACGASGEHGGEYCVLAPGHDGDHEPGAARNDE